MKNECEKYEKNDILISRPDILVASTYCIKQHVRITLSHTNMY